MWPVIFNEQVAKGNPDSQVCIITLWTKKEHVIAKVHKEHYAAIGQLYSKDEGLNAIVRNCLANKNIRHLIVTGVDLSGSGQALVDFFTNGVKEDHQVIGKENAWVDKEIPLAAIETLRTNVTLHDLRDCKDYNELNALIETLPAQPAYGEPELFPRAKMNVPNTFASEQHGFIIREEDIGTAWLHILYHVMRFGVIKPSEHHAQQRELLLLTTVIQDEDPRKPNWKEYYRFTKKDLENYYPQVLTGDVVEGVEYTYGQRFRAHHGVDQVDHMVEKLKASKHTRRAIAFTWDVKADHDNDKAPCLDIVQAVIQNDVLYLTAYFRSQDMFNAWPMNAYALRMLQYTLAEKIGCTAGSLAIISNSAHIYETNWEDALRILDATQFVMKPIGDPRGDYVITIEGHIKVTHLVNGKRVEEFYGDTAYELYKKMVLEGRVSQLSHAFYLGTELMKAETCLKQGKEYVQDKGMQP